MIFHDLNPGVSNSSTIHQPQQHSLCVYTLLSQFTRRQFITIIIRHRQRKLTAARMSRPHLSAILFPTAEEHVTDYLVGSS